MIIKDDETGNVTIINESQITSVEVIEQTDRDGNSTIQTTIYTSDGLAHVTDLDFGTAEEIDAILNKKE